MAYQTEQKKALLAFLRGHQEDAFSIEQLSAAMAADPALPPVGKSTLYRLISQLVEEGSVKRFTKGHSRHFLYQLLPHCGGHLHLRCSRCGKLYHMEDGESAAIIEEIVRGGMNAPSPSLSVKAWNPSDAITRREPE